MNILATGSSGFLGQALCPFLESNGHTVTRLSSKICDLRNPDALTGWNHDRIDLIYHLAAWTQAGDFCLHHQGEQWIINQQINTNLRAWWREAQPQAKLVCIVSSCAYPLDRPLVEENYLEGTPIESLFAYAMTKRMLYGLAAWRIADGARAAGQGGHRDRSLDRLGHADRPVGRAGDDRTALTGPYPEDKQLQPMMLYRSWSRSPPGANPALARLGHPPYSSPAVHAIPVELSRERAEAAPSRVDGKAASGLA